MTPPASVPRADRREVGVLLAILVAAVATRVVHFSAGLPGAALLSPDENTVVPKAIAMVHDGTANPHWFLYPSAFLSAIALITWAGSVWIDTPAGLMPASPEAFAYDPSPYILTGRTLSALAGIGLVVAVWLLGRRAFGATCGIGGAAIVAVSPLAVSYSHVAVTDMAMTALVTFGLWQLVDAVDSRRRRPLLVAAAVIGLATSTKYNAGLALVPLLGVAWWMGAPGIRRTTRAVDALRAAAVALAAFLVGTPYALLDAPAFWSDFARQNRIQVDGWLGFEESDPGVLYNLSPVLWLAVGLGVMTFGAVGLGLAARQRTRADWVLVPYAVVSYLYVSSWSAHFDRYLLPILPVIAVMAARAAAAGLRAVQTRAPKWSVAAVAVIGAALLAQPAVNSAKLIDRYGTPDPRLGAATTIAELVPREDTIAVDPLSPPLLDREVGVRLAAAGIDRPSFRLIRLVTPQPGRPSDPGRNLDRLQAQGVRWVVTSADIERRVRAASDRYPLEVAFYDDLTRTAVVALRVPAGLGPAATLWNIPRSGA